MSDQYEVLAVRYGTMISNRVVDAVGDLAGGIRVPEQEHEHEQKQKSEED